MRKITANVYMTLDGRGEFPKYPGSDRETRTANALFRHMWIARYADVTTVVMGRRSFLGHRRVWASKARKPSDPKFLHAYSQYLDNVDKVCLSRRLKSPGWENSRVMKGDLAKIVADLRREDGGNIMIEGGPRVVQEVLRRRLADDYWFFVMPVVYGKGPRYWGPMPEQNTLKLLDVKHGEDGEIMLHYGAVRLPVRVASEPARAGGPRGSPRGRHRGEPRHAEVTPASREASAGRRPRETPLSEGTS
jgi:dihydrofolate reductase